MKRHWRPKNHGKVEDGVKDILELIDYSLIDIDLAIEDVNVINV